jgi:hypothetical protein
MGLLDRDYLSDIRSQTYQVDTCFLCHHSINNCTCQRITMSIYVDKFYKINKKDVLQDCPNNHKPQKTLFYDVINDNFYCMLEKVFITFIIKE